MLLIFVSVKTIQSGQIKNNLFRQLKFSLVLLYSNKSFFIFLIDMLHDSRL